VKIERLLADHKKLFNGRRVAYHPHHYRNRFLNRVFVSEKTVVVFVFWSEILSYPLNAFLGSPSCGKVLSRNIGVCGLPASGVTASDDNWGLRKILNAFVNSSQTVILSPSPLSAKRTKHKRGARNVINVVETVGPFELWTVTRARSSRAS